MWFPFHAVHQAWLNGVCHVSQCDLEWNTNLTRGASVILRRLWYYTNWLGPFSRRVICQWSITETKLDQMALGNVAGIPDPSRQISLRCPIYLTGNNPAIRLLLMFPRRPCIYRETRLKFPLACLKLDVSPHFPGSWRSVSMTSSDVFKLHQIVDSQVNLDESIYNDPVRVVMPNFSSRLCMAPTIDKFKTKKYWLVIQDVI